MSSLVAEVLALTGTLDQNDLQHEIGRISNQMENLKGQVQTILTKCYMDFDPLVASAFKTKENLRQLNKEAEALKDKIHKQLKPQLSSAVSEYENLSLCVQKTDFLADIISRLVTIGETVNGSQVAVITKDYLRACQLVDSGIKEIASLEAFWKSGSSAEFRLTQALRTECVVQKERLIYNLGQLWSQHIVWVEQGKTTILRIHVTNHFSASSLIQALEFLDHSHHKLKIFSKNFMVHFVGPILRQDSQVQMKESSSNWELSIKEMSTDRPTVQAVLSALKSLFVSLIRAFDSLSESSTNTLMHLVGQVCAQEFCSRLIKECLEPAVPSQSKDFDAYRNVSSQVDEFQSYLRSVGFLSTDQSLSYTQNVEYLLSSKRCQEILVQARETMKEDLHVMMSSEGIVKDHSVKGDCKSKWESEKQKDLNQAFSFPKCQISIFTGKVLSQLHNVLHEACSSDSKEMSARLFYTARHLSQMYCDVVPIYHQDNILLFPQQTAVHHNNCMFLSHHLMTLHHAYSFDLSQKGVQGQKTFIDIAQQLRTIGTLSFLQQMRKQRALLLDFLQDQGVFQNMSSKELLTKGSRAVKQCLVHLLSLKKVWSAVLPWEVYMRSVGTLCNSCLEEIIFRVVSQDDIAEETAGHLDSILTSINSEMPKLFQMPKNVDAPDGDTSSVNNQESDWRVLCTRHIKKWAKFQELRIVLKSSLRDIVERWASGQGPLASEATAEEVKQLIRALFQNTDRRAAALAKIKEIR